MQAQDGPVPGAGRIFAVVGPSGAGKDTLIGAARAAVPGLHVVRRVITRPESPGAEAHEGVTEAEFARREAAGAFVLTWRAHGLRYGIPAAAAEALAAGRTVVFNGSRHMLGAAAARFPGLRVILVTAPPEVLAARLARRGRESRAQIRERLARAEEPLPPGLPVTTVVNDRPLQEALADFVAALGVGPAQPDSAAW